MNPYLRLSLSEAEIGELEKGWLKRNHGSPTTVFPKCIYGVPGNKKVQVDRLDTRCIWDPD